MPRDVPPAAGQRRKLHEPDSNKATALTRVGILSIHHKLTYRFRREIRDFPSTRSTGPPSTVGPAEIAHLDPAVDAAEGVVGAQEMRRADADAFQPRRPDADQIGRASVRARVGPYGSTSVVAVT